MKSRLVAVVGLALFALMASSCSSSPMTLPSDTSIIASSGFGDPANSFAWSMTSFNGKLYVGTARFEQCVERQTAQFYFPLSNSYFSDSTATCPANWADMDLRAEIWEYDPVATVNPWRRVYQSTQVPNPRAPGKMIARDIGYRNMIVVDGRLYAAGVTANEFVPELSEHYPPQLVSTTDGVNWQTADMKLPSNAAAPAPFGTIHTPWGHQRPMGMRAMANVNGQLYLNATGGLTGDGAVVKVDNPSSLTPTFTQVSPPSMAAYELEPFNGQLYVGTGSNTEGYSVWRLSTWSNPPSFVKVMGDGAGRGKNITSVIAMKSFKGKLYVGSSGWYSTVLPSSELIAIGPDGHWDVVVGVGRTMPDGSFKAPTSGFTDGFGNIGNGHFWRMVVSGEGLYLGTNDWTWTFATTPGLENLIYSWEYGFDVFGTCDGTFWWGVTRTAFNSSGNNFGARTMAELNGHFYVGSANHVNGTTIYRNNDVSPCTTPGLAAGAGGTVGEVAGGQSATKPVGVPERLLADPEVCGTVLSWDSQTGEPTYVVRRAEKIRAQASVPTKPNLLGAAVPDSPSGHTTSGTVESNGDFEQIGVTTANSFVDRSADPTKEYVYQVSSDNSNGTGAVAIAFTPARAAGTAQAEATDRARQEAGLDTDALRAARGVATTPEACGK